VNVLPAPVLSVNSGTVCAGETFVLVPSGATTYTFSSGNATVTPLSNTVYSVSGTDGNGCISSVTGSVNVLPTPVLSVNSGTVCAGETFVLAPSGATTYTFSSGSATVNLQSSGLINVSGTGTNGCVGSATSTLTVHQLPIVSVNSGSICNGTVFTILPTGASTYTFSNGTNVVSPAPGNYTYTVTGTDLNGCISPPATSSLTVNANPSLSILNANATICQGESLLLTASGANTYTWNDGSNSSANNVSPQATAVFSVTGISSEGCSATAQAVVFVSICTGINLLQAEQSSVTAYPNPFQPFLMISSPDERPVRIYDAQGRIVFAGTLSKGNNLVPSADWSPGIYLIRTGGNEKGFLMIRQ
jgi:hypothetical protein